MSVVLEPPLTRSGAWAYGKPHNYGQPLATGPRYVRTRNMSRWHRSRSGTRRDDHVTYYLWCGAGYVSGEFLAVEQISDGLPACGTCEGRACGAGQDEWPGDGELLFSPRRLIPPKYCPGSRRERFAVEIGRSVGQCLACGTVAPMRCMGSVYSGKYAITQHEPGPGLVPGCPFHAWNELAIHDGTAKCLCQIPRGDQPEVW